MAHPFDAFFNKALAQSTSEENKVLATAEALLEKGYRAAEIHAVLCKFSTGRIDDMETEIATEAAEEFSRHL